MEELFSVEESYFCGCFPDVRANGILGQRTIASGGQKSLAMGSKKTNGYGSDGTAMTSSGGAAEETEETLFEPTSLHKYSTDLRETKFNYFQDGDEDDILVPSYDLSLP